VEVPEDKSDYASYTSATNQDMELWACVDGLEAAFDADLSVFRKVTVVTDSKFIYWNRTNALYWNRDKSKWKTISWDPIIHKKKRQQLAKYIKNISYKHKRGVDFDLVKWHEDNEYNNKADKSAVKWAQSKTRIL